MSELMIGVTGNDTLLGGDLDARFALAERIENSSIDHLFIADHISFHTGLGMDGIVNAATLAAIMPRLSIVIGVYLLALRHPVPVARQLSSLSHSAPGRIVLGVGVGGEDRHEMEICGVDPAKRGRQTNHSLQALQGLLSGESTSYECEFFQFQDALIKPSPKPQIPIIVGGRSDAAVRRAALLGTGWLGVWISAERFAAVTQQIEEIASIRTDKPQWQHGVQLWAGVGKDARSNVGNAMESFYRTPFEKFEKYSPYGTPANIAEFLMPYIENGGRIFNVEVRADFEEERIDAVAEISSILHRTYPEL
jgi:alkanesulfonate monooxygenase SsuD/methylene tetrahydromethanopterin reductase-like flavin-dependent oxidoreductase (luciferase family)